MNFWMPQGERSGSSKSFWIRVNPDAINLFCNPLEHLQESGWHEIESDGVFEVDKMIEENGQFMIHSVRERELQGKGQFRLEWRKMFFRPTDRHFIRVGLGGGNYGNLSVWAVSPEEAQAEFEKWWDKYSIKPKRERTPPKFEIITIEDGRPATESVEVVTAFPRLEHELALHYGSDFPTWLSQYRQTLRTHRSGLTIFRGEPGTGKTTLLRHLISKLRLTHRFYYLPTDNHEMITSPKMADFWAAQNRRHSGLKKVVILEDAESLLIQRSGDNRAALSNVLNVADGLLGEFLNLHLVCTINCEINQLDPAIIRSGRLLDSWQFRKLTAAEALKLCAAKKIELREGRDDYSLAEIYNGAGRISGNGSGKPIGFAV
jgi:hypothetical protein